MMRLTKEGHVVLPCLQAHLILIPQHIWGDSKKNIVVLRSEYPSAPFHQKMLDWFCGLGGPNLKKIEKIESFYYINETFASKSSD